MNHTSPIYHFHSFLGCFNVSQYILKKVLISGKIRSTKEKNGQKISKGITNQENQQ